MQCRPAEDTNRQESYNCYVGGPARLTLAPLDTYPSAIISPIPLPPPVTRTTCGNDCAPSVLESRSHEAGHTTYLVLDVEQLGSLHGGHLVGIAVGLGESVVYTR
jgi:hypothetical protein